VNGRPRNGLISIRKHACLSVALAAALLVWAAALAVAAGPSSGRVYAGESTSTDPVSGTPYPVSVRVADDGRSIEALRFENGYDCKSGSGSVGATMRDIPLAADGTFHHLSRSGKDKYYARGRLGRMTGVVTVQETFGDGCTTAATRYRLTRGARTYGGSTSQDYPLRFRLAPSRKSIEALTIFWQARCVDRAGRPFPWMVPTRLVSLPLVRGSFSRQAAYSYRYGGHGATIHVRYTVSGAVGASRARGRFRAGVTARLANGTNVLGHCASGTIRWNATSA
jgi:hypothetical protein